MKWTPMWRPTVMVCPGLSVDARIPENIILICTRGTFVPELDITALSLPFWDTKLRHAHRNTGCTVGTLKRDTEQRYGDMQVHNVCLQSEESSVVINLLRNKHFQTQVACIPFHSHRSLWEWSNRFSWQNSRTVHPVIHRVSKEKERTGVSLGVPFTGSASVHLLLQPQGCLNLTAQILER